MPKSFLCLPLCFAFLVGCSDPIEPGQAPEQIVELDRGGPGVAYVYARGLCEFGSDCAGFVQLLFSGTLRVDRFREIPRRLHTARVTDEERSEIVNLARAPALRAYLADPGDCVGPTEASDVIYLHDDSLESEASIYCNENAIALKDALKALADKYFE